MNLHLRPLEMLCIVCKKPFHPSVRKQGGGIAQKYCSHNCADKAWRLKHPEKRKAVVLAYESVEENRLRKQSREKTRGLKKNWGWSLEDLQKDLVRQNYACYGCLERIDEKTAKVDHCHIRNRIRGLLCNTCNLSLGALKDCPATLRRLTAYLDHDRTKTNIYLIGALKNDRIPEIGNRLRAEGFDVMDEWFTPGPEADTNWQKYEKLRGRTYSEALRGRAATNIFLFDRSYIDLSDIVILVMPAGKSAMIELGYAKGRGKRAYIFLDGQEPERYDIMPGFADKIFSTEEELLAELKS